MPSQAAGSEFFIELGAATVGLAVLARIANRIGFSAIPLYLLAGLAFGNGGIAPLPMSEAFIHLGAEIGVLLLLFMLGLEYTAQELRHNLRFGMGAGVADFVLNFTPGFAMGLILRWHVLAAVLLGGVTWISSSGVIAKVLSELKRMGNPETPSILSILVLEDLAMAAYLPLVAVLLIGGSTLKIAVSVSIAIGAALVILVIALRYGKQLSAWALHESDEVLLLTTFGAVLLVAGVAERLQVSAAIGAFLVGIAFSGPIAERAHHLLSPLRDLFAATFFFFFGLQIDPSKLPALMPLAFLLGAITALTKLLTGYFAVAQAGINGSARWRAGATLVARGEFSMVIAALGATLQPEIGSFAAAYVLFLVVVGPVLARFVK